MGIWYRGSNADDPLALRTDGNGNEENGPGIYFFDRPDFAEHYGTVKAYRINTKDNRFYAENSRPREICIATAEYLIKRAPDYQDTLSNWAENPSSALRQAVRAYMDIARNDPVDFLETIANDFYDGHPAEFMKSASSFVKGIIVDRGNCKVLVLYDPSLAKEVKGWAPEALAEAKKPGSGRLFTESELRDGFTSMVEKRAKDVARGDMAYAVNHISDEALVLLDDLLKGFLSSSDYEAVRAFFEKRTGCPGIREATAMARDLGIGSLVERDLNQEISDKFPSIAAIFAIAQGERYDDGI